MANTTLNWEFRKVLKEFRHQGRLSVYVCYLLHANAGGRAYPSMDLIVKETGWAREACVAAKKWLTEHSALVPIPYNKRFGEDEKALPRRLSIMQITGQLTLDGQAYNLLHFNSSIGELLADSSVAESSVGEPKGSTSLEDVSNKDSTANAAPSEKPKAERPRDAIFDAIGWHVFGLRHVEGKIGARIGMISGWLKKQEPDVGEARIADFKNWYEQTNPGINLPRDLSKFQEHWLLWEQGGGDVVPVYTDYGKAKQKAGAK